ncbi:hypothetical protein Tco_1392160 [Tanacetum coccineum]
MLEHAKSPKRAAVVHWNQVNEEYGYDFVASLTMARTNYILSVRQWYYKGITSTSGKAGGWNGGDQISEVCQYQVERTYTLQTEDQAILAFVSCWDIKYEPHVFEADGKKCWSAIKKSTCCLLVLSKPIKGELGEDEQKKLKSGYDQVSTEVSEFAASLF